jgi:membrane AbrB-like protein
MATDAGEQVWWRDPSWWLRALLTYTAAGLGGALAAWVSIPLPWMLGPFFTCGALAASGLPLAFVPLGREVGQLAVGLAVGLRFTPATLAATASLLPAMLAATAYVIAYTFLASFILRPLAGVDRTTAFFATAAGGVADMAIVAQQKGGEPGAVAMVHALRVSITVATVPILVTTFGAPGTAPTIETIGQGLPALVLALALALLTALAFKRTPLPNPWLVGPIFLGIALSAGGLLTPAVPPLLIIVAQIAIGTWLGCRFRRDVLSSAPRVAAAGIAVSLFMIMAAAVGALALAGATGLPVTTSFLALAPAAVTEMVITAKVMHLDAAIVTAFHVMRIAIVCSTILVVFKLYGRIQGAADESRL